MGAASSVPLRMAVQARNGDTNPHGTAMMGLSGIAAWSSSPPSPLLLLPESATTTTTTTADEAPGLPLRTDDLARQLAALSASPIRLCQSLQTRRFRSVVTQPLPLPPPVKVAPSAAVPLYPLRNSMPFADASVSFFKSLSLWEGTTTIATPEDSLLSMTGDVRGVAMTPSTYGGCDPCLSSSDISAAIPTPPQDFASSAVPVSLSSLQAVLDLSLYDSTGFLG